MDPQARHADLALAELESEMALLRQRAVSRPWGHAATPISLHSPAGRVLRSMASELHLLDIAGSYKGCHMSWLYAALEYSHEGQSWYKDCYADLGLPTSRTAYMHFDADVDVVKALFYLQDVTSDGGPFRYVRGSHLWERSPFACAFFKGLDMAEGRRFEKYEDGLDFKDRYYRPWLKSPIYRREILQLPPTMRGSTHFGDDILDDTPLSSALLSQEVAFTGPKGTLVLFDGASGIHRGGQVRSGSRWAFQLAFKASRRSSGHWKNRVLDVYQGMRYRASSLKRALSGRS